MVPRKLKNLHDVEKFKSEIRKWEPKQCKIILPYVQGIGYVNVNNN